MSNDVENCPAEEFVKLCFADDVKNFWNKFYDWQQGESFYTSDIDPDQKSKILYDAHRRLWNKQCSILKLSTVPTAKHLPDEVDRTKEALVITGRYPRLGSDSIMSIYWHRTSGDMPEIMKKISQTKSNYKEFIKEYLKKANTIGGFILFPRHANSINQRRGRKPFDDRFDLALECIRRAFMNESFSSYNPLFNISAEDKDFFKMFGTFQNYAKFFCLDESYGDKHNWVNENGQVLNLMNNEPLNDYDFSKEPLPNAEQWWTFYDNIMNRLDARNEQIKKLIQREGN